MTDLSHIVYQERISGTDFGIMRRDDVDIFFVDGTPVHEFEYTKAIRNASNQPKVSIVPISVRTVGGETVFL